MEIDKIVALLKSELDSDNLLGYYIITHNNHNIRLVNEVLNFYNLKLEVDLSNNWIQIGRPSGFPTMGYRWKMVRLPGDYRDNIIP